MPNFLPYWAVETIGCIGMLLSVFSYLCNSHKKILMFKSISEVVFACQFFFLGAYTGMCMNGIGLVRNSIFTRTVEKGKNVKPWIIIFCLITIGLCAITWKGWISVLAVIAKLLSTVAYGFKNPHLIRLFAFPAQVLWIFYDIYYFTFFGILADALSFVTLIYAEVRYYLKKKKGNQATQEETGAMVQEEVLAEQN